MGNINELRNSINELKNLKNELKEAKKEEVVTKEETEEAQQTLTCIIQLAKTSNGMPSVNIQGDVIDALGLLEYARMYLDEELIKFISNQKNKAQKENSQ